MSVNVASRRASFALSLFLFAGCAGGAHSPDAAVDGSLPIASPALSRIAHVVVIVQENQTFDTHFGRYCTAKTGSNPACTDGPACCEAGPDTDPGKGGAPKVIDDAEHARYRPPNDESCELSAIDGGKMDRFVTDPSCGGAGSFGYSDPALVQPYWQLAARSALADRYFQPTVGASSANDMYLARARFVFPDNSVEPDAIGARCSITAKRRDLEGTTLGDLLVARGVTWATYAGGYQSMIDAARSGGCPDAPPDCTLGLSIFPCVFDPGDVPFEYYPSLKDNPLYMRDLDTLAADLAANRLPQVVFVKAIGYRSEHPGLRMRLSDGVTFAASTIAAILASPAADDTLVLLAYDEGGGYFDHVPPPPVSAVDQRAYGTRVPLMAVGRFARRGHVSHAVLEHSSIVRFIEWNWLGGVSGQLGGRDAVVNDLGSLLDPAATGTAVPE